MLRRTSTSIFFYFFYHRSWETRLFFISIGFLTELRYLRSLLWKKRDSFCFLCTDICRILSRCARRMDGKGGRGRQKGFRGRSWSNLPLRQFQFVCFLSWLGLDAYHTILRGFREHKTAGGPPDCTGKEGVVEARRGNRGRISTTSDPGKRGQ